MRKSKRCTATVVQSTPRLVVRVCVLPRNHDGDIHHDARGNWKMEENSGDN